MTPYSSNGYFLQHKDLTMNKKLRVLYPIGFFYPAQIGGPCNTIYWMTRGLVERNIDVTAVAMNVGVEDYEIKPNTWLRTNYGKVIYLSTWNYRIGSLYVLMSIFKGLKSNVIHLTSIFAPTSVMIGIGLLFLRKSVVWSPRGELDPPVLEHKKSIKKIILSCLKLFKSRIIFHTTCNAESSYVKLIFGKDCKIIQIPNFLELPKKVERQEVSPYLFFIGRIHSKKAIDNLIKGLSESEEFLKSDYVLKIAGDDQNNHGTFLKNLTKKLSLEDKVHFLGHVSGQEKEQLLANAYFMIMPSHTENFGNVVVESLAQGTPVIASRNTPWGLLEDKKAGYWIDNSPESLANSIDQILLMGKEKYNSYRINSIQLARNNFEIHKNIQTWVDAYQSTLLNDKK